MGRGIIAACLAVALAGAAPAHAASDAAKGKAIFMADGCYECHGTVGQGSRSTGPRLARTQLPLDAFLLQLRQPSNEMPPYEPGLVSDEAAADIYAFLQSLPAPVAAKDVPLLNQ